MPTCTARPQNLPRPHTNPPIRPGPCSPPATVCLLTTASTPCLYFPSTASSTAPAAAYTDLSGSGTPRCPMQRVSLSLALLLSSFLTSPSLLSPFLCSAASPLLAAAPHPAFDLPSAPNVQRSEGPRGPLSLSPLSSGGRLHSLAVSAISGPETFPEQSRGPESPPKLRLTELDAVSAPPASPPAGPSAGGPWGLPKAGKLMEVPNTQSGTS